MAGSDGPAVAGGPARHVPVLARPALELLNVRDGGIYIDGTFGAGGYTPRDPRGRRCARHRHRPRPERGRDGAGLVAGGRRPADAGRGALLRARSRRARNSATPRSTASCSISASPRCSSTRPSAASRSGSTARSTCAWAATGRAPPTWWRRRPSAISPHHLPARRGAPFARRRARHRRRPQASADRHHQGARRHRRARRARQAEPDPSGDADVPGAAHLRQRGAGRARRRRSRPPSASSSPAAGSSS